MPNEYTPRDGVRYVKNVVVAMSDGVRLAMDLHVPDRDDWRNHAHPVLLEYIPYRKDDAPPYVGPSAAVHNAFAQQGYIAARLDCRGTGSSEGVSVDEYTAREQRDGVEAIEWLAQQPWCTGKVAMFGSSYGGFTAIQVAAHRPPHLATIMPVYFTDDRYTDDCHYRGGCLRCYYDIGAYGASMIGMNAMPAYPEHSGEAWARIWEEHLAGNEPYLLEWLAHQTDGEYWRGGSVRGRYEDVGCPVFMIGGWRDGYPNPPLRTFERLAVPRKVLIGPWNHSRPDVAIPGPRIDYVRELIRWCDFWLKGNDNGVMDEPPVTLYMQSYDEPRADRLDTQGYWRTEPAYPIRDAGEHALYLRPNGVCAAEPPTRSSDARGSATGGGDVFDAFVYRPTVGIAGGLWSGGVPFGLPTDQRSDEVHALTYTTEPLDAPLEIIGRPRAVVHAASTATVMAFVARLCDVAPDGTSALVCSGVLNATRRDSLSQPAALEPDAVYELSIDLDCTAWRFEPGHCIRLSISSADFPNLWPTPFPGLNRVYRDAEHPSRLVLPIAPLKPRADETSFEPSKAPVSIYRLSPAEPVWEIVSDVMGDRTGLMTRTRSTSRPTPATEVGLEARLELWASNRDPADVAATGKHSRRIVRNDGVVDVTTSCAVRSTAEAFHATIDLQVAVNGLAHHQRRWVRSFPRTLL